MRTTELRQRIAACLAVICFVAAVSVFLAVRVFSFNTRADTDDDVQTFSFDVAQDADTYQHSNVVEAKGQETFSRGVTFIPDGSIYPAGTLPAGKADNDPRAPGGIRKYTQRATSTIDSAGIGRCSGFGFCHGDVSLPDDGTTVLTDGVSPNESFTASRVVLGGTGRFRNVVGEIIEQNLGSNKTGFCNLRLPFRVKKAAGQRGR